MDAYISKDIQFDKFYITNSLVLAIYPEVNQRIRLDKLKIKCDFEILNTDVKDNYFDFIVNFNVLCNEEEKPGYLIDIGAVGEFRLNNFSEIGEKTEKQYILFTALPMVINSIRICIQNITSMYEFGSYMLPAIDLVYLIKTKELINEQNEDTLT